MKIKNKVEKFHIVWLGESGFPYGLAAIQKTIILGDALSKVGVQFTVINRKGVFKPGQHTSLKVKGEFEGIQYVYVSGSIHRPNNPIIRNFSKIKGIIYEYLYLRKLRKENNLEIGIVSNRVFFQTLLYLIYGTVLNFPVIYLYVEMASAMQNRGGLFKKINDYIFDHFLLKRMDGVLPISEILVEHFRKSAPGKPILKIPTICNFENFNLPKREIKEPYFLFCGAFGYREVINFILESYEKLETTQDLKLYLIISGGSKTQYEEFNHYLKKFKKVSDIKIFSNIPFAELIDLYLHATALLIPLRPTKQDAARFPHKIAEYTATGNPIITTNFGEISYYFKDGENALVAASYNISAFAEKMNFVIENSEQAKQIGQKGKELGLRVFNHIKYGPLLKDYLKDIISKKRQ